MSSPRLHVALALPPVWDAIAGARAHVIAQMRERFGAAAPAEYVGMVASELLENAVRYGDWSRGEPLGLEVSGTPEGLVISVRSRPLGKGRSAGLAQTLDWIAQQPSPRHAYQARVELLARESTPSAESRLGLVRIVAEGQCALAFEEERDGFLRVHATVRWP